MKEIESTATWLEQQAKYLREDAVRALRDVARDATQAADQLEAGRVIWWHANIKQITVTRTRMEAYTEAAKLLRAAIRKTQNANTTGRKDHAK